MTQPDLAQLRKKPHWSFSSLNTFLNICSQQWAYRYVYDAEPEFTRVYQEESGFIESNAGVGVLSVGLVGDVTSSEDEVVQVLAQGTLVLSLGGLVDLRKETERLGGELAELDAYKNKLSARLEDESFLSKAPAEVVDRERQRLETAEERRSRVEEILSRLGS